MFGSRSRGPSSQGVTVLDHATAEVVLHRTNSQSARARLWTAWNYPLHVGSILGMPSKMLWLAACLVLMALPFTGIWMWWQRRPAGQAGLPRSPTCVCNGG